MFYSLRKTNLVYASLALEKELNKQIMMMKIGVDALEF